VPGFETSAWHGIFLQAAAPASIAARLNADVREFLAKHPVGYPIAVAGLDALEWLRSLGNVGGGLPFSVVFDSRGALAQRKLGEIAPPELAAWVTKVS